MRTVILAAAIASLGLHACAGISSIDNGDDRTRDSQVRWSSHKLSTYEYEIENECYCTIRGRYRVTVKNNRIIDVFDLTHGIHLPQQLYAEGRAFRTIDDLFTQIDAIRSTGPEVMQLSFDPVYGHPVSVLVDGSSGSDADELVYHIRHLETRSIW